MPRPISERRRLSDERRNNGRPAPYRRGGRQRRQVSRFVIDESVNDDDDTGKYHFKGLIPSWSWSRNHKMV